jgi:hypothetical protein
MIGASENIINIFFTFKYLPYTEKRVQNELQQN